MSIQEQLAPYLNRFVILFHQNASAKLELSCTNGKVSVNIMHDFGVVEKTVPPKKPDQQPYNEVLKKNLKQSQINRLQKEPLLELNIIILALFVLSMPEHNPFFSDIGSMDII